MMIRVGQPPTKSAAPITTAPKKNWRTFAPRLIDENSPLRRAAANDPTTSPTTVKIGQPAPALVTNRFLPSVWLTTQSARSRPWQAEQRPYAAGGETPRYSPTITASVATTIP